MEGRVACLERWRRGPVMVCVKDVDRAGIVHKNLT